MVHIFCRTLHFRILGRFRSETQLIILKLKSWIVINIGILYFSLNFGVLKPISCFRIEIWSFWFGSKILEMPWGMNISKVSARFSSVLNSLQFSLRFDFRFRAFLNCCNNKIVYLNLVNEELSELWSNKLFQFFIGSRICEPNRTENRRKKPNRWELYGKTKI